MPNPRDIVENYMIRPIRERMSNDRENDFPDQDLSGYLLALEQEFVRYERMNYGVDAGDIGTEEEGNRGE